MEAIYNHHPLSDIVYSEFSLVYHSSLQVVDFYPIHFYTDTERKCKMAKKSFDHVTNSWLYRLSKTVGDVVIISALFLLFCLPVVTIGASVSALYYTVYRKYYKKHDEITKDFMHSLKDNLKDGIIIHLIYLIFSAIAGFNIYFAFFGIGNVKLPEWYTIVSLVPLIPVIFSLPFVYPLLARFNNGIKATIKNSFTLCMINFPKFLLIWLIVIAALAVTIVFPPAMLVTPTGAMYLCQMITEKAFSQAIEVEKARDASEDEDESEEDDTEEDTNEEESIEEEVNEDE